MNYFELVIAILVTICTGLLVVTSIVNESPMKGISVSVSLLMFLMCLGALVKVAKEIKQERKVLK